MRLPLLLLDPLLRIMVKRPLGRVADPIEMRARFARHAGQAFRLPRGAHVVADRFRREDGSAIPAVWTGVGRPSRGAVILSLHGGAYIAGSPRTHLHLAAALAAQADARAVLPDYRLAPEAPYPAGLEDAVTAYSRLLERGYLAERIAIAGDSAGGGLALACLHRAVTDGLPQPAALALFSPWTDLTLSGDSLSRNARRDVMLPRERMEEVVALYAGTHDPAEPGLSPLFAEFADPPPTLVMASRSELLTDDATRLANRLRAAGGDVHLELWPRMPHAWPMFVGRFGPADRAVALAGRFLAKQLGTTPTGDPAYGDEGQDAVEAG